MAKLLITDTRTGKTVESKQEWDPEFLERWIAHTKEQSANPVLTYEIID